MVPLDLWLGFVAATVVLLMTPGPVVTLLLATGLAQGRSAALAMIPGIVLGDLVALSLSLLGVGSLLMLSATLFTVVKWLGAAYLVVIGVRMWCEAGHVSFATTARTADPAALRRRGFLVNVLNPKSILFFIAFLPQFVSASAPAGGQLAVLGATFLALGLIMNTLIGVIAGGGALLIGPRIRRLLHRLGGAAMIGGGLLTATLRRA